MFFQPQYLFIYSQAEQLPPGLLEHGGRPTLLLAGAAFRPESDEC